MKKQSSKKIFNQNSFFLLSFFYNLLYTFASLGYTCPSSYFSSNFHSALWNGKNPYMPQFLRFYGYSTSPIFWLNIIIHGPIFLRFQWWYELVCWLVITHAPVSKVPQMVQTRYVDLLPYMAQILRFHWWQKPDMLTCHHMWPNF